jgi:uncharacterized protein (UPF0335 family)
MTEGNQIGGIAADALRQFVERIERLREEVKALNADVSDVYKQVKSQGFDPKVVRAIVAERAKEPSERDEFNDVMELYRAALGM